jgi:GNAT superfamily N-acetyltransferase
MPDWPLALRQAEATSLTTIIGMIDNAAAWLRTIGTDQWARPWPSAADRNSRIQAGLARRTTWICWDQDTPAATLTVDPEHDPYWSAGPQERPAVYVHRLVVAHESAGLGLGAALLNWAGRAGRQTNGAFSVRVSAWTTNTRLHEYYRGQGFLLRGFHADDGYPSAARFEKLTSVIPFCWPPLVSAPTRLSAP